MKNIKYLFLLNIFAIALLVSGCGSNNEGTPTNPGTQAVQPKSTISGWAEFRGPTRSGVVAPRTPVRVFPPSGPSVLFRTTLTGGYSSIAIDGGRACTMTYQNNQEIVLCLDALTGEKLWEHKYAVNYREFPTLNHGQYRRFESGPTATPAISGKQLFTLGLTGKVHAFDVATGRVQWTANLREIAKNAPLPSNWFGYSSSPLVRNGKVFLTPGGNQNNSVAALQASDGKVLWTNLNDSVAYGAPLWANVRGEEQVIFPTGHGFAAVNPNTGQLRWRHALDPNQGPNVSTPIFQDNSLFYSFAHGAGSGLLRFTAPDRFNVVWTRGNSLTTYSSCVRLGDHVYGMSTNRLRAAPVETGRASWAESEMPEGALIAIDNHLVVITGSGELRLVRAAPNAYQELARFQLLQGERNWISPSYAEGILYVRNETQLVAVDLGRTR